MHRNRTFVPGVGVQGERPAVGVDPEGAELLRRAVADGGAPGPAVEPEHERRGLRGRAGRLDEPVEERPPRGRVHGDVPGVHGEVDRRLPRQARDAVRLRLRRRSRAGRGRRQARQRQRGGQGRAGRHWLDPALIGAEQSSEAEHAEAE